MNVRYEIECPLLDAEEETPARLTPEEWRIAGGPGWAWSRVEQMQEDEEWDA